jgi:hypothetical protein
MMGLFVALGLIAFGVLLLGYIVTEIVIRRLAR